MNAQRLRARAVLLAAALVIALATPVSAAAPTYPSTEWFTVRRVCGGGCPSTTVAGSTVALLVTAHRFGEDPWTSYLGTVTFVSSDPNAVLPEPYAFTRADQGDRIFHVVFRTAGWQTVTVIDYFDPAWRGTSGLTIVAASAHRVSFAVQPRGASAGGPLSVQPKVAVQDEYGNLVSASTAPVSLAVVPPAGISGSLACTSGTTVSAVAGTAAFSGCSIDTPGAGYRLTATSAGLAADTSAPFDITPGPVTSPTASAPATAIALTALPTTVAWPGATVLSVALAGAGAGRIVRLERRDAGSVTWSQAGTISTDALGAGKLDYIPNRTAEYRAVWPGDATLPAATSAVAVVAVRFQVIVSPSTTPRRTTVGKALAWTATLRPVTAGVTVRFRVYRAVGGTWVLQATSIRTTSSQGKATFSRAFSSPGSYSMLVTTSAGPANAPGSAPRKYVTVR
jgi:hypothetical protein